MENVYALYAEGKNIEPGIKTGEKKNKISLKFKNNKIKNVNENRIITTFQSQADIDRVSTELEEKAASADIKTLYELLDNDTVLPLDEMTELLFEHNSDFNKAAAYIALKNDNIYFKEKNKNFIPAKSDEIEKKLEQLALKEKNRLEKIRMRENALEWFKNVFPDLKDGLPDYVLQYIESVKNYAIYSENYKNKFEAKKIMREIKNNITTPVEMNSDAQGAFCFCFELGIFNEHENMAIHRFNIITGFKDKELEHAQLAAEKQPEKTRVDLTGFETYSIDDETTKDIDDAFSIVETKNGYSLYVHIADAAFFIEIDSVLDKFASNLGMSVYLSSGKISMFPPLLSENKISLKSGNVRPALTFITHFDRDLNITDKEITQSIINVDENLSYNEVDNWFYTNSFYKNFDVLEKIIKKLRNSRLSRGAVEFMNPDYKVSVKNGKINIIKNVPGISFSIIKELMVLTGYQAASFCLVNNIPCVYVSQDEPLEPPQIDQRILINIEDIFSVIKKLNKANLMTTPFKHYSLGLECYTQCTSPIRRYHDLIIQRQIKSFLNNEPLPYSIDEIQKVSATSEIFRQNLSAAEREEKNYWLLKSMESRPDEIIYATVIYVNKNDYQVFLDDYGLQTRVNSRFRLKPGDKLKMLVKNVNPRAGTFSLKHYKEKKQKV